MNAKLRTAALIPAAAALLALAVTGCTCVRNGAHPCVYDLFPLARAPKATAVLEVARAEVLI